MSSPGSRIRVIRKKILNMTQHQFAESLGTGASNLSRIEAGEYPPQKAYLELLREKFDVNPTWILSGEEPMFISRDKKPENVVPQRIPILANIPAGPWEEWIDAYEIGFAEDFIEYPNIRGENLFAVRVKGDSMEPRLFASDVLIIDPHRVFDGGIAVVRHDWGYKIRSVRRLNHSYLLVPFNPAYKEEEIEPNEETAFYVPIKVVCLRDV